MEGGDRGRQSQSGVTSPNAFQNIRDRLELPGQGGPNGDFATGYSLGLIGGVRSWASTSIPSFSNFIFMTEEDKDANEAMIDDQIEIEQPQFNGKL